MITKLVLTYPDRETALAVARALSGNPDVEAFPPDGWLEGFYYNIAEIGEVRTPAQLDAEGNVISGNEVVPGWHLLGAWQGPPETVPAPVWAAHVEDRPDWWPRMG